MYIDIYLHVGNHHHWVHCCVGELERLLDALDVVGEHARLAKRFSLGARRQRRLAKLLAHTVPTKQT